VQNAALPDAIIEKHKVQAEYDWMVRNFTVQGEVPELHHENSYASRLYSYMGQKNQVDFVGLQGDETMKRNELEAFIMETYNAVADYPWRKSPNHEVFRHCSNRKWFALIMDVPKNKLGLQGEELLDVVNLKCDQILIGSLRGEPGFFPAYHMSKDNWITAALDGSASDDKIKMLLDMSYQATAPKMRKRKG
jgi:hypothetical protein